MKMKVILQKQFCFNRIYFLKAPKMPIVGKKKKKTSTLISCLTVNIPEEKI